MAKYSSTQHTHLQQMLNFSSANITIILAYAGCWSFTTVHTTYTHTHSKWIGNKSNVGENMFCMRFDVVCFWWQKQKYCFFTTHPTHFVNRYCALVVAAAVADGAVRFVVGSFFSVRVCVSFFRSFPLKNPFCVKRRTRWNGVYGRRCCLCTIYT